MITSCASIKYPATPVSVMTILGILVEYTSCASTTPTRGHILVNTSCASIKYRPQYVDPLTPTQDWLMMWICIIDQIGHLLQKFSCQFLVQSPSTKSS